MESQLKEDKFTLAESERKYEDIARKLHGKIFKKITFLEINSKFSNKFKILSINLGKEEELIRSDDRCQLCERKIIDLEEELRIVGQNLQQLEVSEEKALKRFKK